MYPAHAAAVSGGTLQVLEDWQANNGRSITRQRRGCK